MIVARAPGRRVATLIPTIQSRVRRCTVIIVLALLAGVCGIAPAIAQPMPLAPSQYASSNAQPAYPTAPRNISRPISQTQYQPAQNVRYAYSQQPNLGGGFIEFLFGGGRPVAPPRYQEQNAMEPRGGDAAAGLCGAGRVTGPPRDRPALPGQVVAYKGSEKPGTVIIDTPPHFLYLVQDNGKAIRYGIGVGRPGFTWAGEKTISMKAEWPDWRPPDGDAASAGPTCRASWRAGPTIRSARARCISARRSTASTARTSPGRSASGVVGLHPHAQRGRHRPL